MNVRVASRVAERRKTEDLRKLRNFKKVSDVFGFQGGVSSLPHKRQISTFVPNNHQKTAVNHSIEKHISLNVVNLSLSCFVRFFYLLNGKRQTKQNLGDTFEYDKFYFYQLFDAKFELEDTLELPV